MLLSDFVVRNGNQILILVGSDCKKIQIRIDIFEKKDYTLEELNDDY